MVPARFRSQLRIRWQGGLIAASVSGILIGYGIWIQGLGVKDFWWDEAHSWYLASLSPVTRGVREGLYILNDPLYTTLLHIWMRCVGHTEFALRYLSLLIFTLSAAYLYRVAAKAFSPSAAITALIVSVSSPYWLFYAQEVRQYALMPILMLGMSESVIDISRQRAPDKRVWIRLIVAEALSLYTHSFMLFAIVGIHLAIAVLWIRARVWMDLNSSLFRKRTWLGQWLLSQAFVFLCTIPMVPFYFDRGLGEGVLVGVTLPVTELFKIVWFSWMGIPWADANNGDLAAYHTLSWVVLILLICGSAMALLRHPFGRSQRSFLLILYIIASTFLLTILFWQVNSKIHPRYLIMLSGLLYIVLGGLIALPWQKTQNVRESPIAALSRLASAGIMLSLTAIAVMGITNIYTGATLGYRHDQTRSLARYLRTHFDRADGIITLDPVDYTLAYYDIGEARLFRAGFDDGLHTPADLVRFLDGKHDVAVVRFHAQRSDRREIADFYLERYGRRVETKTFAGYRLVMYQMDGKAPALPVYDNVARYRWGDLVLTGYSIDVSDALTVSIQWEAQPGFSARSDYSAILRIIDPVTGWQLGQAASNLQDERGRLTSLWQPSTKTQQYLTIPFYPGTPPIALDVTLTLVDNQTGQGIDIVDNDSVAAGQSVSLGTIQPGDTPSEWIYGQDRAPFSMMSVESEDLFGYALSWPTAAPGGSLGLALLWNESPALLDQTQPVIRLLQGERIIAEDGELPLQGRAADLNLSQPWLDYRVLNISQAAMSGPATIIVQQSGEILELGTVQIEGFTRITEPPAIETPLDVIFGRNIRLAGYDLEIQRDAKPPRLLLVLYWQALADGEPQNNLKVFAHALAADSSLVAQHDSVPAYDGRPVSGWVAGEYIIDEHPISLNGLATMPEQIRVGLYNPDTLERLLTERGDDSILIRVRVDQ